MRAWCVVLLAGTLAAAAPAAKPNFSGEWKLSLLRSEYGNRPPPKKLTEKITHKEPNLTVEILETSPLDQDVKQVFEYKTDGTETTSGVLGSQVKSTAKWEGNELAVHSWTSYNGQTIDMKDRWRLTENGTTIIVTRAMEGPTGKFEQTIVLDKQ